LYENS